MRSAWSAAAATLRRGARRELSVMRPAPLPEGAPTRQQTRDLKYGHYQDHPGYGCDPQRVVAIFRDAELGLPAAQCDLIDDVIERDCTLRNLFEQRDQSVAGKNSVVQAGGPTAEDELAARVLSAALEQLDFIDWQMHQLGANRYGWAASEIDWGTFAYEGRIWIVPVWLANVPARRFRIDPRTNQLLLVTEAQPQGEPLERGKWTVTKRPGPLARAGLMRSAIWPALWKGFSARDWVVYSEMFGIPLVQASYDDIGQPNGASADLTARDVAEEIVEKIGSSGGAATPRSVEVKIHQARDANSAGTHGALIAFANAEMSKLIAGATLTNDNAGSGGASYALGEVHASVRWDNVVFDAARLQQTFRTQVAAAFVRFNGLAAKPPVLRIQIVRDDTPKGRLECADIAKNKLGIELSMSQLRQETGFREPLNESDAAPGAPAKAAPTSAPASTPPASEAA